MGAVVAVIVLLLLVAIVVILYLRRGSEGWSEKQASDFDNQEYRGVSPHYTAESGAGKF